MLSNLNNFHSLELQVGENSNLIIKAGKDFAIVFKQRTFCPTSVIIA